MINIKELRASGSLYGFEIKNHGQSAICAAVSSLSLNTVNSLEVLVDCELEYEYDPDGGYLLLILPELRDKADNKEAELLLNSMRLGLCSINDAYKGKISYIVEDKEVL